MGVHAGWDDTVRLGETSQRGVLPAGVVPTGGFALIHQVERACVGILSSIRILRQRRSALEADFSPGFVFRLRYEIAVFKSYDAGRAEVITEHVVQCTAFSHCDVLRPGKVVFEDDSIGYFSNLP